MDKKEDYVMSEELYAAVEGYNYHAKEYKKTFGMKVLYNFLFDRKQEETIIESANKLYEELGKTKADEVIDIIIDGCDKSIEDMYAGEGHVSAKPSVPEEICEKINYHIGLPVSDIEKLLPIYALRADVDEAHDISLGTNLAKWYRSLIDRYEGLTYSNIFDVIAHYNGQHSANVMFNLAIMAIGVIKNELIDVKKIQTDIEKERDKKYYEVGKEFKEYLASEEFLGKRKSLKR